MDSQTSSSGSGSEAETESLGTHDVELDEVVMALREWSTSEITTLPSDDHYHLFVNRDLDGVAALLRCIRNPGRHAGKADFEKAIMKLRLYCEDEEAADMPMPGSSRYDSGIRAMDVTYTHTLAEELDAASKK